jgi:serine/threonine protein kinase
MRDRYIPESLLLDYLSNIIEGLSSLHKNNIFNINITPQNIYINDNIIKLNPYISLENLSSLKICNNDYFGIKAPELKINKNYTVKTDIWYLGLLIYEITQLKPIDKDYLGNKDDIYDYIIRGNYPVNNYYSNDIKELIKLCLQYTPNKRPSTSELSKIIEIYKKNKILNNKINSMINTKKSYNFKRKINLKDEIAKINQTLAKIKNYDNKGNKIYRDLTPVITRKNSNCNLNFNVKNFLFKNNEFNYNGKFNNAKFKKPRLKLKTSFINNLHNNNYGYKTGKKFFGIHKNNETLKGYLKTKPFDIINFVSKNPAYFQYERNKTTDDCWRKEKSVILIKSYENHSLWKEAKYRKLNEYLIKQKDNNYSKKNFKRANSINYCKKNKKLEYNRKNNKINSGKLKIRNISPFNKNNKKVSNSFYLPYKKYKK